MTTGYIEYEFQQGSAASLTADARTVFKFMRRLQRLALREGVGSEVWIQVNGKTRLHTQECGDVPDGFDDSSYRRSA